jgi:adsorption protein B
MRWKCPIRTDLEADCLNFVVEDIFNYERDSGIRVPRAWCCDETCCTDGLKFSTTCCPARAHDPAAGEAGSSASGYELVAGTYMDEFAESHARDGGPAESVSGMVPSAGVRTCFSRKALINLIRATHISNRFNIESLIEGLRRRDAPGVLACSRFSACFR